jgi:hypothetical protein
MQRQLRMIMLIALVVLAGVPAVAADDGWTVRFSGAWVKPRIDVPQGVSDVPVDVSSSATLGFGASLEYRLLPWIGLSLDALHARPDILLEADLPDGRRQASSGISFTPFNFGPAFHLTPGKAVDLSVTATLGFAHYGDLLYAIDGEELSLRGGSTVVWGLGAALDIHPGASRWGIHAGVSLYQSSPEFTNRANGGVGSVTFKPVMVTLGVAYRF